MNAALAFTAIDMRPSRVIEGEGMIKLASALVEVGAKYGVMDMKSLLPDRNTLKRKALTTAESVKSSLVMEVNDAILRNGMIGMTTDMWTDIKNRHFVSLTVHFAEGCQLQYRTLTVYEFEGQKSGENIRKSIIETCKLLSFPLQKVISKIYFVTDNGSNIKSALADFNRLPCACHMLAVVLHHTLQLQSMSKTVEKITDDSIEMAHVHRIQELVPLVKSITA